LPFQLFTLYSALPTLSKPVAAYYTDPLSSQNRVLCDAS